MPFGNSISFCRSVPEGQLALATPPAALAVTVGLVAGVPSVGAAVAGADTVELPLGAAVAVAVGADAVASARGASVAEQAGTNRTTAAGSSRKRRADISGPLWIVVIVAYNRVHAIHRPQVAVTRNFFPAGVGDADRTLVEGRFSRRI
ncbi:hypothetical protein [Micromonospora humida]|uniref:hypothetical protein n=1 Tax=Micromonospora humida TaxID=2809018 RepID=UPI0034247FAE